MSADETTDPALCWGEMTKAINKLSHHVTDQRKEIEEFLSQVYLTNSIMIYSPSQIALAAIIHAASKQQENVDSYVTEKLFQDQSQEAIMHIITCVR